MFVGALVAAGYEVFAVNPFSASRYRDRHVTSGAKSDPGDAEMLADLVRTDRHAHRPIAGDTDLAEAVKVLARPPPVDGRLFLWGCPHISQSGGTRVRNRYPRVTQPAVVRLRAVPRSSDRFGRPVDVWPGFPDGDPPAGTPVGLLELGALARALRDVLGSAGLTVVALAESSGVDRTTIHDLLAGRAYIDVVTLARLEHATGTSLWPRHRR